ncbi:ATP-binding protein [Sphaerisporangium perillae]|uniref:ATP-binding protein n=1 Tax=Sphaerisporangium perillae TaxID=2935860 RepID=UPI00200CA96E|nr:ATP-binding protein [Sphaerisporangium perillae]
MTPATKTPPRARHAEALAQIPAGIGLIGSELRSTNLERDVREKHLNSPYVGARALDVLERVTNAVADLRRTRAWSFTGPYGSGKSTLSNLFDAFLGHDPSRQAEAQAAVAATSPGLATRFARVRDQLAPEGFLGAVATAHREPLAATVHRALQTAAERRWNKRPPQAVAEALVACMERQVPTTANLIDAVTALCNEAPLLLIIDEFGKTLEHLAVDGDSGSAESDVFLLQVLAEKGAGRSGLPLFMFTLQHLAFTDYAARSSTIQTQEWAKIQGRFEDITFAPNLGDAVHLMRRRLDLSDVQEPGRNLIREQAEASAEAWSGHALKSVVDISTETFADLYPLHPITAIAAPLLASQIGQHDRSLTGFLASDEPNTVRRTLETQSADAPERASTIRLPQLYDYFFASGRTTILASTNASRWLEVDNRLNEAHGLPPEDQDLLKVIGILNLIDADGVMRATPAMIQFALHDPVDAPDPEQFAALQERLKKLTDDGFVVHRVYSNEYRIWQGTDVDIDARVREIATRIAPTDVVQYFNKHLGTVLPAAVVAGGHSQRTGMLRYFVTAVSHQTEKLDGLEVVKGAADGLIVYHLGSLENRPVVNSPLPVLIGTTKNPTAVLQSGITLVALEELLEDDALDHVAAREIAERAADISRSIGALLGEAFNPLSPQSTWNLWGKGTQINNEPGEPIEARSYAGLASRACDQVYPFTPHIRNEMVGRNQLTSNAARARRELLTAMLQRSGYPLLGYETGKYTPERAMYHGVLEYLGLHRAAGESSSGTQAGSILTHGISRPSPQKNDSVMPVWAALEDALTSATQLTPIVDIYHRLMAPPYGVKAGVVPILVVTALILRAQDIALFENGNYCQRLTPEVVERLNVPYPDRFAVKATPVGGGQRRLVVDGLGLSLDVDTPRSLTARNPQLLAVTRAMLERIMVLQPYARQTRRLSSDALAIREVLSTATDPDELVFTSLPKALGFEPIQTSTTEDEQAASAYVSRLVTALDELSGAGAALRQEVVSTIGREFRLSANLEELRSGLAERLRGFSNASLELNLQGFISRVLNENLPDDDWLDPIIIRLTNKALGDWTDRDVESFPRQVREVARALDRVSHLYEMREAPTLDTEVAKPRQVETHLLTLTTPQGTEERTLIHVPKQSRQATDDLVVSVIRQAEEALGPDGARILLAALAERLAATDTDAVPQGKEKL